MQRFWRYSLLVPQVCLLDEPRVRKTATAYGMRMHHAISVGGKKLNHRDVNNCRTACMFDQSTPKQLLPLIHARGARARFTTKGRGHGHLPTATWEAVSHVFRNWGPNKTSAINWAGLLYLENQYCSCCATKCYTKGLEICHFLLNFGLGLWSCSELEMGSCFRSQSKTNP